MGSPEETFEAKGDSPPEAEDTLADRAAEAAGDSTATPDNETTQQNSAPESDDTTEATINQEQTLIQGDLEDVTDAFTKALSCEHQDLDQTLPQASLRPQSSRTTSDKLSVSVRPRNVRSAKDRSSSEEADPPSQLNEDLDYEMLRLLGEGGMATVHLARQVALGRDVALKRIHNSQSQSSSLRDEFLTEAVLTGKLEHPNIVPIYEVGRSASGDLFYSMKNIKGQPWDDSIGNLSLGENLGILINVCDAIAFAHAEGVVHRDLKPANIMTGGFGEVLVLDWGLAVMIGTQGEVAASAAGTPAYMAPEMVNPPFLVGPYSDIYLLGGILYRIMTGNSPHGGSSTRDCLRAAAKNQICSYDESHAGELMDIALKAMHSDTDQRHQSVQAFQQAIKDYLSHSESIDLSSRADEDFQQGRVAGDYTDFNRAIYGFEQAISMWDGNHRAAEGLTECRVAYAQEALKKGDFDLGMGQLAAARIDDKYIEFATAKPTEQRPAKSIRRKKKEQEKASEEDHVFTKIDVLYAELEEEKHERDARIKRLRFAKRAGVAAAIIFGVSVTGLTIWALNEADNAAQNLVTSRENEAKALTSETQAKASAELAVERQKEAQVATQKATKSAEDAKKSAALALTRQKEAQDANVQSQKNLLQANINNELKQDLQTTQEHKILQSLLK